MQFRKCVVSLAVVLLAASIAVADDLAVGLQAGYARIFMDDSFTRAIEDGGFGLAQNYRAGITLSYKLGAAPIRLFHTLNYRGGKNEQVVMDRACPESSTLYQEAEKKYSASMLSFYTGVEYLAKAGRFSPFVAANMNVTYFSEVQRERIPPCGFLDWLELQSENPYVAKLRAGAGLGVGTYFTVSETLKLKLSAGFDWLKLFGKKEYEFYSMKTRENDFNELSVALGVLYRL